MNRSVSGTTIPPKRFADAIATALRRECGGTHAAIKTVVALTGANERAVKNWFDAKNGPSGEYVIALCAHSDDVLETLLLMAGRTEHVKAKKIVDATNKLREILALLDDLQSNTARVRGT
jgi:hypothetical protein